MTGFSVRLALAVVRVWTLAYTAGMPSRLRDRRRREIDSELAEACGDDSVGASAAEILARLVLGVPDDFLWRIEQVEPAVHRARRLAAMMMVALAMAALWMVFSTLLSRQTLPLPPPVSHVGRVRALPPPPSPPPPPCPPSSMAKAAGPCTP